MGKVAKIGIGLVIVVIAAVAIMTTLLVQNLDGIIKQVVEATGSEVTGTRVSLGGAKFTLTEGRGELQGLSIANPSGFSSKNIFEMDTVAIQVDPTSLTGSVIVIDEVTIDGARLLAEQKGLTTNLKALMENMDTGEEAPPPEEGSAADVRLMLAKFNFVNIQASLLTEQWGEQNLTLPPIRLQNLGDRETGLTPTELANQITGTLVKQTQRAVADRLAQLAQDAAKEELGKQLDKNLDEDDKKNLDKVKSLFGK